MKSADLMNSDCVWMPPTTWHLKTEDGYLLVTALRLERSAAPGIPTSRVNLPKGVLVFLADERGNPVDADGDPLNGMTPLLQLDEGNHEDGLSAAGYELRWE